MWGKVTSRNVIPIKIKGRVSYWFPSFNFGIKKSKSDINQIKFDFFFAIHFTFCVAASFLSIFIRVMILFGIRLLAEKQDLMRQDLMRSFGALSPRQGNGSVLFTGMFLLLLKSCTPSQSFSVIQIVLCWKRWNSCWDACFVPLSPHVWLFLFMSHFSSGSHLSWLIFHLLVYMSPGRLKLPHWSYREIMLIGSINHEEHIKVSVFHPPGLYKVLWH